MIPLPPHLNVSLIYLKYLASHTLTPSLLNIIMMLETAPCPMHSDPRYTSLIPLGAIIHYILYYISNVQLYVNIPVFNNLSDTDTCRWVKISLDPILIYNKYDCLIRLESLLLY